MSTSSGICQSDILTEIIESEASFTMIKQFIDTLANQKVLDLFIHEENLKKLSKRLIEEEAFHDPYAELAKDGPSIQTRYVYFYAQNLARIIYDNDPSLVDDIFMWVKPLIEIDQDPKYSLHLFCTLADYAAKMRMLYVQAIEIHFSKMEFQYENEEMTIPQRKNFWRRMLLLKGELGVMLDQAFPVGIKYSYKSMKWMKEKPKTFTRVNFEAVITPAPFNEIMTAFAEYKEVYFQTRKTTSEIESKVLSNFKGLILDDVFDYIEQTKGHKTSNIINAVICKLQKNRNYYMNMRLIQAFYMFYREDFAVRQKEASDAMLKSMPELYGNSNWKNIVIPS